MPRCKAHRCWAPRQYRYDIHVGGCYVGNDPVNATDPGGMATSLEGSQRESEHRAVLVKAYEGLDGILPMTGINWVVTLPRL